ncbi:hypothetical protein NEM52_23670, partial [Escherichia coli]|nr:hypothetical protein [Escherichia coli]
TPPVNALAARIVSSNVISGCTAENGQHSQKWWCVPENVGLGEAAKRDVGTGDNQIPDMGAFASGSGWFRLPGGYIVQFGT